MKTLVTAALAVFLATGCASLTNNTSQPVIVATTCGDVPVQGAFCRLINANGSWNVNTPGVAMVRKAPSDMAVECKMPTSTPVPTLYESHAGLGTWGNLIAGGIVGFGFDAYRDAAWRYDSSVVVDMCKGLHPNAVKAIQDRQAAVNEGTVPATAMTMSPSSTVSLLGGERKWAVSAEKMTKERGTCSATPTAVLSARGPATEIYTVGCNSGDVVMLKCTWGDCKFI